MARAPGDGRLPGCRPGQLDPTRYPATWPMWSMTGPAEGAPELCQWLGFMRAAADPMWSNRKARIVSRLRGPRTQFRLAKDGAKENEQILCG
jgi:hypothetical protein